MSWSERRLPLVRLERRGQEAPGIAAAQPSHRMHNRYLSACVRNSTKSACARSDSPSVHSLMVWRRWQGYVCACCTCSWQFMRLSASRVLASCSMRRQSAVSCATACEKQLVPSTRSRKPSAPAPCCRLSRWPAGDQGMVVSYVERASLEVRQGHIAGAPCLPSSCPATRSHPRITRAPHLGPRVPAPQAPPQT